MMLSRRAARTGQTTPRHPQRGGTPKKPIGTAEVCPGCDRVVFDGHRRLSKIMPRSELRVLGLAAPADLFLGELVDDPIQSSSSRITSPSDALPKLRMRALRLVHDQASIDN